MRKKSTPTPLGMAGGTAILNRKALKAKYLDCFAARFSNAQTLLEVIKFNVTRYFVDGVAV